MILAILARLQMGKNCHLQRHSSSKNGRIRGGRVLAVRAGVDLDEYRHAPLTRKIIGVFFETVNELGTGFAESVCRNAFAIALRQAGLRVETDVPLHVIFRGEYVGLFRADIIVERVILIEVKVAQAIEPWHQGRVLNYLRASDLEIGLLFNFGPKPEFKRFILSNERKRQRERMASHSGDPS
jgi:GxxExxY protein